MATKLLIVGNAAMDMILQLPHLPEAGGTLLSEGGGIFYQAGGAASNCAIALGKLGGAPILAARLGGDVNGQRLHTLYTECGVATSALTVDPRTPTGTSVILLESDGTTREVIYPGAAARYTEEDLETAFSLNPGAVCIQMGIAREIILAAAHRAHERGLPIVLFDRPMDPDFPLEKMPPVEIACFNEEEIECMTGIRPNGENSALQALLLLQKKLKANYYVIKMGNRGCFLFDGVHRQLISPYLIKVIDAAGGGDAFVAGMCAAYFENGGNITNACRYATAVAAVTLMRAGTVPAFPTKEEINGFIAHNGLK